MISPFSTTGDQTTFISSVLRLAPSQKRMVRKRKGKKYIYNPSSFPLTSKQMLVEYMEDEQSSNIRFLSLASTRLEEEGKESTENESRTVIIHFSSSTCTI